MENTDLLEDKVLVFKEETKDKIKIKKINIKDVRV
jgi:hypothetical protein